VGLESAETALMNPGTCASEGVCSDTEDAGEVEAECEASGVLGGEERYARMDGLGIDRLGIDRLGIDGLGMTWVPEPVWDLSLPKQP